MDRIGALEDKSQLPAPCSCQLPNNGVHDLGGLGPLYRDHYLRPTKNRLALSVGQIIGLGRALAPVINRRLQTLSVLPVLNTKLLYGLLWQRFPRTSFATID